MSPSRVQRTDPNDWQASAAGEIDAEVEFQLLDANLISMAVLHESYVSILLANNANNCTFSHKRMKKLLLREIPDLEFHKPKCVNEPERVSIKCTRDAAIQHAEESNLDGNVDMSSFSML